MAGRVGATTRALQCRSTRRAGHLHRRVTRQPGHTIFRLQTMVEARDRIGGLVQLTVRVKPAQKKRKGRNPATGEEIEIAAKGLSREGYVDRR
ncbi:MAG: HU family DNA-binding protein [Solirubrobacteraceae bacterium]